MRLGVSCRVYSLDNDNPGPTGRRAPPFQNSSLKPLDIDLQPVDFIATYTAEDFVEGDRGNECLLDLPVATAEARRDFLQAGRHPSVRDLIEFQHSGLIRNRCLDHCFVRTITAQQLGVLSAWFDVDTSPPL